MPVPHTPDVALRLSQWLGPMDAVRLDGALRHIQAQTATATHNTLDLDLLRTRWELGRTQLHAVVAQHAAPEVAPRARTARMAHTSAAAAAVTEPPVYAVQQKRYGLTQRTLAQKVAALRAGVRQLLEHGPQTLRQLAALDAVMDTLLTPHEQKLWESIPVFLERRWKWRMASAEALPAVGLRAFEQDMQALLGAELGLRLTPIQGLVEAAENHPDAVRQPMQRRCAITTQDE